MRAILFTLVFIALVLAKGWCINAYLVTAFGVRVTLRYDQILATLASQGFSYRKQPSQNIPDATEIIFVRGPKDSVRLLILNPETILSVFPSEIAYKGSKLCLGDTLEKCYQVLGHPDRVINSELTYRDSEHMVPVLVTIKDGRIAQFELAPGPDQYEEETVRIRN